MPPRDEAHAGGGEASDAQAAAGVHHNRVSLVVWLRVCESAYCASGMLLPEDVHTHEHVFFGGVYNMCGMFGVYRFSHFVYCISMHTRDLRKPESIDSIVPRLVNREPSGGAGCQLYPVYVA